MGLASRPIPTGHTGCMTPPAPPGTGGLSGTGITVTGTGTARTPVDTATLTCGVDVTANDAGDAFRATATAAVELRAALARHGIDEHASRTVDITLGPKYDYADAAQRIVGYQATQKLTVTVTDLAGLGELLSAISDIHGVRIDGLALAASSPREAETTARTAAMMDARDKAGSLAALAGRPLGPVLVVDESAHHDAGARPLFARDMAAPAAMPIAAGDTTISVAVRVQFAWAD